MGDHDVSTTGLQNVTVNGQPVQGYVGKIAPTQQSYPWRTVVRTGFQALVSGAAMVPLVYQQATHHDPAAATGFAAAALGIAAGLTRVMAVPAVDQFLTKYVPFLAATPKES